MHCKFKVRPILKLDSDLYLRFYKDDNLSFYFTNDPNKEETTGAIIQKFNERQEKEKKQ